MKKEYIQPVMEVVDLKTDQYLLTVSDPGYGGGNNAEPEAPEFEFGELLGHRKPICTFFSGRATLCPNYFCRKSF